MMKQIGEIFLGNLLDSSKWFRLVARYCEEKGEWLCLK